MSKLISLVLACFLLGSTSASAHGGGRKWGGGIDFTAKAAAREKTRWSLTEWLEMKNRNRMMDMWLSMNTPSPFEFMVGVSHNSFKTEDPANPAVQESHISFAGELSAYAQFVGLSAEYENNTEESFNDSSGLLNVRLLGNSIQNTSFTIHYGYRTRESATERFAQQFGQASIQVYLAKYFGIDGKYRQYIPTSKSDSEDIEGYRAEAGLFIDFKAFRVFGNLFQENQKIKSTTTLTEASTNRSGIRSGIKVFF